MPILRFNERSGPELTTGGKLRFNVRDDVLKARQLQFGTKRISRALLPEDGLGVSVLTSIDSKTLATVAQVPKLRNAWNKLMRSFGAIMVADSERIIRRTDTIDTGLTLSGFSVKYSQTAGLITDVLLVQVAPYFKYIHPKGKKGRTLYRNEFQAAAAGWSKRLLEDIEAIFKPILAAAEKAAILRELTP